MHTFNLKYRLRFSLKFRTVTQIPHPEKHIEDPH